MQGAGSLKDFDTLFACVLSSLPHLVLPLPEHSLEDRQLLAHHKQAIRMTGTMSYLQVAA